MQFADPTLITLVLSSITSLVILAAMVRIRSLRIRGGIQTSTFALLLAYIIGSLGWVIVQGMLRLQILRLIVGFDTFALSRIALYILFALAVVFFQLTRMFLRRGGPGLVGWIGGAVWLLVCALLYENPFPPPARLPDILMLVGADVVVRGLLAFYLVVIGWAVFIASAIILTIQNYQNTVSPLHRNRTKYWTLAIILAAIGGGLYLVRLDWPGNLLHLFGEVVIVYVLLTFNLPDLRMAARRSASFLIMLLLTVTVYTGGFYAIQQFFQKTPGYNPLLAGGVLALALAILFNPLLGVVRRFVNRLITGTRYDVRQTLSEYSMGISNILDMDVLATIVIGLISEAMEISHGALVTVHRESALSHTRYLPDEIMVDDTEWKKVFLPDDAPTNHTQVGDAFSNGDSETYLLSSISGLGEELPEGRLSGKNPAVYYLRREHHPLTQYDIDLQPRFQMMEPQEREWLSELRMDVFVPIYAKENWIGLLALGPKSSGDPYYAEDLNMLQTLADQTAVALENARLYQDLKQRNAENERLNVELKAANSELARLDQAKSDFINIASHELRTPLTQVIGYNDILGEMIRGNDLQPAVGVQMVDSVRKAARRLEEIVETMFDVSKLDTKTLDLMRAPVSPSSIITVALDTWAKGLQERKLTVSVRGVANLPTIVADGKRLTQVFSHLIQNAIKSTPDGGQIRVIGRVVIPDTPEQSAPSTVPASASDFAAGTAANGSASSTTPTSTAAFLAEFAAAAGMPSDTPAPVERYVELVIADTGIGIAAEDLERIFQKFYRVGNVLLHSTGDTKFKGAGPGLGLTIARGIVEAHGGRIWAESPGHDEETCPGAKFHVLLPIKTIAEEKAPVR